MKAIFCINAGRSGLHYLSELFRHVDGVESHHEPEPNMQGIPMVSFNYGDPAPIDEAVQIRLAQIREANDRGNIWFESNNAFVKGFGERITPLLGEPNVGVVILRRDAREVARSLLRHNWSVAAERDAEDKRNAWLLWPGMTRNLVPPPLRSDPVALSIWYVAEVAARACEFRGRFPGARYFDCRMDELNDVWKVMEMLWAFELQAAPGILTAIGEPTNTTSLPKTGSQE